MYRYSAKQMSVLIYKKITQKCNTYIHYPDKSKFNSVSSFFLFNSYVLAHKIMYQ